MADSHAAAGRLHRMARVCASRRLYGLAQEAILRINLLDELVPSEGEIGGGGLNRDNIKQRLEDAGRTLMMLPMPINGSPRGCKSGMPEVVRTPAEFYAAQILADRDNLEELLAGRNVVRVKPQQKQLDALDECLRWLWFIKDAKRRRVVTMRSLKHPVNDRRLYSWPSIAGHFDVHHNTVKSWHAQGIDEIFKGLLLEDAA